MPRKRTPVTVRFCCRCKEPIERGEFNGRPEDATRYSQRRFCSKRCAGEKDDCKPGTLLWRARQMRGPSCEACGTTLRLHAHHVDGQQTNNTPANIQTLCTYCHRFLHAVARRLGWDQPGRLPPLRTGRE